MLSTMVEATRTQIRPFLSASSPPPSDEANSGVEGHRQTRSRSNSVSEKVDEPKSAIRSAIPSSNDGMTERKRRGKRDTLSSPVQKDNDPTKQVQENKTDDELRTGRNVAFPTSSKGATDDKPRGDDKSTSSSGNIESDNEGIESSHHRPSKPLKTSLKSNVLKGKSSQRNLLTHLIPGYTAPMKLDSSSLDRFRPAGGIRELQKRAERTDKSTKDFVLEATTQHTNAMQKTPNGFLPKSYADSYSSFKRGSKRPPDTSAGKGWFGMTPTEMTEELKTDLAVIRNRTYLDPKRFYKSTDKHHKVVQVGTVIEGPSEYFSSRLTKKQRRNNLTEEIMADPENANYAKNKFKQMSREKTRQTQMRKLKPKRVKKFY